MNVIPEKELSSKELNQFSGIELRGYSRKFCLLVPISRRANARFALPCERPCWVTFYTLFSSQKI